MYNKHTCMYYPKCTGTHVCTIPYLHAGVWRQTVPMRPDKWSTEYPTTGTSVLLPLTPGNGWIPEVLIIGGASEQANGDTNMQVRHWWVGGLVHC